MIQYKWSRDYFHLCLISIFVLILSSNDCFLHAQLDQTTSTTQPIEEIDGFDQLTSQSSNPPAANLLTLPLVPDDTKTSQEPSTTEPISTPKYQDDEKKSVDQISTEKSYSTTNPENQSQLISGIAQVDGKETYNPKKSRNSDNICLNAADCTTSTTLSTSPLVPDENKTSPKPSTTEPTSTSEYRNDEKKSVDQTSTEKSNSTTGPKNRFQGINVINDELKQLEVKPHQSRKNPITEKADISEEKMTYEVQPDRKRDDNQSNTQISDSECKSIACITFAESQIAPIISNETNSKRTQRASEQNSTQFNPIALEERDDRNNGPEISDREVAESLRSILQKYQIVIDPVVIEKNDYGDEAVAVVKVIRKWDNKIIPMPRFVFPQNEISNSSTDKINQIIRNVMSELGDPDKLTSEDLVSLIKNKLTVNSSDYKDDLDFGSMVNSTIWLKDSYGNRDEAEQMKSPYVAQLKSMERQNRDDVNQTTTEFYPHNQTITTKTEAEAEPTNISTVTEISETASIKNNQTFVVTNSSLIDTTSVSLTNVQVNMTSSVTIPIALRNLVNITTPYSTIASPTSTVTKSTIEVERSTMTTTPTIGFRSNDDRFRPLTSTAKPDCGPDCRKNEAKYEPILKPLIPNQPPDPVQRLILPAKNGTLSGQSTVKESKKIKPIPETAWNPKGIDLGPSYRNNFVDQKNKNTNRIIEGGENTRRKIQTVGVSPYQAKDPKELAAQPNSKLFNNGYSRQVQQQRPNNPINAYEPPPAPETLNRNHNLNKQTNSNDIITRSSKWQQTHSPSSKRYRPANHGSPADPYQVNNYYHAYGQPYAIEEVVHSQVPRLNQRSRYIVEPELFVQIIRHYFTNALSPGEVKYTIERRAPKLAPKSVNQTPQSLPSASLPSLPSASLPRSPPSASLPRSPPSSFLPRNRNLIRNNNLY